MVSKRTDDWNESCKLQLMDVSCDGAQSPGSLDRTGDPLIWSASRYQGCALFLANGPITATRMFAFRGAASFAELFRFRRDCVSQFLCTGEPHSSRIIVGQQVGPFS
jgi:hypothetical protein